MKDFFISYSSIDEAWAEWIAWELEVAGYNTMMQKWDFTPGKNFAIEMNNAILYATRIILVLSESFLLSDFTQSEWVSFFSIDPTGEDRSIIPIRVEECQPNGLLKQIVYIDFVGRSETQCRKQLLDGIKLGRHKPTSKPAFPASNIDDIHINHIDLSFKFPESDETVHYWTNEVKELIGIYANYDTEKHKAPLIENRQIGRAFIRELFDTVIHEYISQGRKLSIIIIDVDGMNGINRRFGVDVGDEVMKKIGQITVKLKDRLLSGRLGDDTYYIVLDNCIIKDAVIRAKKMLDIVNEISWINIATGLYVTCSVGVAQFYRSEIANATVTRAVQGQQVARTTGGNRVVRGPKYIKKGREREWVYFTT